MGLFSLPAPNKTRSGLKVRAELDSANYPKGLVVSDEDFAAINIDLNNFHGDWNYHIRSAYSLRMKSNYLFLNDHLTVDYLQMGK